MIVLTIIGVITAIIMPIAFNSVPNENIMKLKKANTTLGNAVKELAANDKYYLDGDLSKKADGNDVTADYFCSSLAEIISYKEKNCTLSATSEEGFAALSSSCSLDNLKSAVDIQCKNVNSDSSIGKIITADNVLYYDANPNVHFASSNLIQGKYNGLSNKYKVICIDIDSIGGEAPFGYAIRGDGRIIPGKRADEWLNKSITKTDNSSESTVIAQNIDCTSDPGDPIDTGSKTNPENNSGDTGNQTEHENNTPKCSSNQYYNGTECVACSSQYGSYCSTCTSTECTACSSTSYALSEGNCVACSSLYGSNCTTCTSTECTACSSTSYALSEGNCVACSELWGSHCTNCTSTGCLECSSNRYAVDSNGMCESCAELWHNCKTCTSIKCIEYYGTNAPNY